MNTTLEVKKFKCFHPKCSKSFNRRDYLIRHAANRKLQFCLQLPPTKRLTKFETWKWSHTNARAAHWALQELIYWTSEFQWAAIFCKTKVANNVDRHLNTKSHEKRKRLGERLQQENSKKKFKLKQPDDTDQFSVFSSDPLSQQHKANDFHRWSSGSLLNESQIQYNGESGNLQATIASRRAMSYPSQYLYMNDQQKAQFQCYMGANYEGNGLDPIPLDHQEQAPHQIVGNTFPFGQQHPQELRPQLSFYNFSSPPIGSTSVPQDFPRVPGVNPLSSQNPQQPPWQNEIFPPPPIAPDNMMFCRNLPAEVPPRPESFIPENYPTLESNREVSEAHFRDTAVPRIIPPPAGDVIGLQDPDKKLPVSFHCEPLPKDSWSESSSFTNYDSACSSTNHSQPSTSTSPSPKFDFEPKKTQKFFVSSDKQQDILSMLQAVPEINERSDLLSPEKMEIYLVLFWQHFDSVYPIIHAPTFIANQSQTELVIAMIVIGMTYAKDLETYNLATDIHLEFRSLVLPLTQRPHLPLWAHQCLLLANYFANVLGPPDLHEMSKIFHTTNMAHIKHAGYLNNISDSGTMFNKELDENTWHQWIEFESKKRTAFFSFICDTQYATLFHHTHVISAFEISLELPCTDAAWTASNSETFYKTYSLQPHQVIKKSKQEVASGGSAAPNAYLQTANTIGKRSEAPEKPSSSGIRGEGHWPSLNFSIRRMMAPYQEVQKEYSQNCFSSFSRLILFHALLSIWWDMQWRGLFDMGIMSKRRMSEFRSRMLVAMKNWKMNFDSHFDDLPDADARGLSIPSNPAIKLDDNRSKLNFYEKSPLVYTNLSLYHIGLVSLYVDFSTLQTFAEGLSSQADSLHNKRQEEEQNCGDAGFACKSAAQSLEQLKAQKAISIWATSDQSKQAALYSAQYLESVIDNNELTMQADHAVWCIFLCTLILWAYEVTRPTGQCDCFSSSRYIVKQTLDKTGKFTINENLAYMDLSRYLISVSEKMSDTGLADASIERSELPFHGQSQQTDLQSCNCSNSHYVMALIAYAYFILSQHDQGVNKSALLTLSKIVERYDNENLQGWL